MDKKWYQSKKFICFAISLIFFGLFIILAIIKGTEMIGVVAVGTLGFITVAYIFGQSYVDKYVNLAIGQIKKDEGD